LRNHSELPAIRAVDPAAALEVAPARSGDKPQRRATMDKQTQTTQDQQETSADEVQGYSLFVMAPVAVGLLCPVIGAMELGTAYYYLHKA
jgi:hypothetical protein